MVEPAADVITANIAEALAIGAIDEARARRMLLQLRCEIRATSAARRRRPPSAQN